MCTGRKFGHTVAHSYVKRRKCATWTGRSLGSPSRVCRCGLGCSCHPVGVGRGGVTGKCCRLPLQTTKGAKSGNGTAHRESQGTTVTRWEPVPAEMALHVRWMSSKTSRALTCAGLSHLSTGTPLEGPVARVSGGLSSSGIQGDSQHTHNTLKDLAMQRHHQLGLKGTQTVQDKSLWIPKVLPVGSRLREVSS